MSDNLSLPESSKLEGAMEGGRNAVTASIIGFSRTKSSAVAFSKGVTPASAEFYTRALTKDPDSNESAIVQKQVHCHIHPYITVCTISKSTLRSLDM